MEFDLLTLFLFVIVVYMVVLQMMGDNLLKLALTFAVMFMGLDYMGKIDSSRIIYRALRMVGLQRVSHTSVEPEPEPEPELNEEKQEEGQEEGQEDFTEEELSKKLEELIEGAGKKEKTIKERPMEERPKPLSYSEDNYKEHMYNELGSFGDNEICKKMKHMSNMNRVAMDNMARVNKYTNIAYFEEELNDHENSVWWEDNEELENMF